LFFNSFLIFSPARLISFWLLWIWPMYLLLYLMPLNKSLQFRPLHSGKSLTHLRTQKCYTLSYIMGYYQIYRTCFSMFIFMSCTLTVFIETVHYLTISLSLDNFNIFSEF
jgi:hypothetical protein